MQMSRNSIASVRFLSRTAWMPLWLRCARRRNNAPYNVPLGMLRGAYMRIKNLAFILAAALVMVGISGCGDKPAPAPISKVEAPAPKAETAAPVSKVEAPVSAPKVETPTTAVQLVAGKDYQNLKTPQPVANEKTVEVLEFFWYG